MGTVTRTVVFTDLANYTAQVSNTDREGLRQILQDHEGLVAPIVQKNGGRVVKNLGDSFMCLFNAATDALRAALDVQDLVMRKGGISIRLAMTTGDVEEIEGDAFGESVNLAARILGKTPAGEVWFGPGTRVCMNVSEIPWETVGRFRLKGLPGEKEIFRAVPAHRCWLPEPVREAVKKGTLVRLKPGAPHGSLPPEPVILFEGFTPGSKELAAAVDALPVLNPASLWLAAYNMASEERHNWVGQGRGLVIGLEEAVEAAIQDSRRELTNRSQNDTIVFDVGVNADVELVMCGLALPAVPLSDVVSSYFYDLLPDGRWMNISDRSVLRVEVNEQGVSLQALAPGVQVNGRAVASGQGVKLSDGARITYPRGTVVFRQINDTYAGLMVSDSDRRLPLVSGQTAELGREPEPPGLSFPDRRGQHNIRWCPGTRAARARGGGFTLDRALAGRRQVAIELNNDDICVRPLHARCPTYVLSEGVQSLARATGPMMVGLNDLVVAGTTVVGFSVPE